MKGLKKTLDKIIMVAENLTMAGLSNSKTAINLFVSQVVSSLME